MQHAPVSSGARSVLAEALRTELARAGSLELDALGSSMEPTVPGGSVLRVVPQVGPLQVDELVAFVPERGALLCCHRVVAIGERGQVLTQGDRHRAPDGFAQPDQIIGVVRSFAIGGRAYDVAPGKPRPRPSAYRQQRQRLARWVRRVLAP